MRVAFIVNNFPVLSQTFILNQITGLIDSGIEVDIYANLPSQTSKTHHDVIKYNLLDKTNYFYIPHEHNIQEKIEYIKIAISNAGRYPILLKCLFNGFRSASEASLPRIVLPYILIPFLKNKQYDIIHCHFGPNGLKGALLKKSGFFTGKLITAFHGYDITQYIKDYSQNNQYQKLFDSGDLFQPISEHWQKRLIELGCDAQKITVHRMGIDCQNFCFMERNLIDNNKIKIVTISRLVEKKGIEYGIRAVAELIKSHRNIEYNIIGDGHLREELEQIIEHYGVRNTVILSGWKDQSEIIEILNQSHILLAPSVTSKDGDREGIPVVLMEAMAMGLPVVSTWHSGIPELVQDGVSGFLVPERDIDGLVDKLKHLVEHPETWAKMGRAGRIQVETNYNIEKLNTQLIEVYNRLINIK